MNTYCPTILLLIPLITILQTTPLLLPPNFVPVGMEEELAQEQKLHQKFQKKILSLQIFSLALIAFGMAYSCYRYQHIPKRPLSLANPTDFYYDVESQSNTATIPP